MAKIKGFSILAKATWEQVWNYIHYWEEWGVEMKVTPFKEAVLWVQDTPLLEDKWSAIFDKMKSTELASKINNIFTRLEKPQNPENFRKFILPEIFPKDNNDGPTLDELLRERGYIAHWEFDSDNLLQVLERWIEYRELQVLYPTRYPKNADGVE